MDIREILAMGIIFQELNAEILQKLLRSDDRMCYFKLENGIVV